MTERTAMTDLVKLNELDKAEWLDVCKRLKPGLTEADYEKLWCQFQIDKWEYQRSRELS